MESFNIINSSWPIYIRHGKFWNLAAKFHRLEQKWRKFWKNLRKLWDLLIKSSMGNWLFQIFTKYFLEFCFSENRYLRKIRPVLYTNFFQFRAGTFLLCRANSSSNVCMIFRFEGVPQMLGGPIFEARKEIFLLGKALGGNFSYWGNFKNMH